jgi:hypothetical protein
MLTRETWSHWTEICVSDTLSVTSPWLRRGVGGNPPTFMTTARQLTDPLPQAATAPSGPWRPHYREFTITLGHTTLGRTLLEEWSATRRDLYLQNHNTHKRKTSMPPAGIEPAFPVSERPQTRPVERVATWMTNRPITSNYHFKQYIGLWVCMCAWVRTEEFPCTILYVKCFRLYRGWVLHYPQTTATELQSSTCLSLLQSVRFPSIQSCNFGYSPGGGFTPYPNSGASIEYSRVSENGTSPYHNKGTKTELLNPPGSVGNYLLWFIAYTSDDVFVKGFVSLIVSYPRKNTDVGDGFTLKTAKLTIFPSVPC